MKRITSATVFSDAVGLRLSATWSEIDENTGLIVSDNQRFDRVITDAKGGRGRPRGAGVRRAEPEANRTTFDKKLNICSIPIRRTVCYNE